MRRMRSMLVLTAALAVAGTLVLANGVSAASATQVDGVMRVVELGDPADITDDVTQVWGDLIGYWWTTSFELGVVTTSGVVHGRGTERFDGCRDVNGNGRCDAGDPAGSLYLTFTYSGKFDPETFALLHGRCHHPITGGTDGFRGVSGVIQMRDDPVTGCTYYRGHLKLG